MISYHFIFYSPAVLSFKLSYKILHEKLIDTQVTNKFTAFYDA